MTYEEQKKLSDLYSKIFPEDYEDMVEKLKKQGEKTENSDSNKEDTNSQSNKQEK